MEAHVAVQEARARGLRFAAIREGKEVGHAFLYILHNDLHTQSFGLLEDLQVDEAYQRQGIARELYVAVEEVARSEGCYKLIATSRNDGTREAVHAWYIRLGFEDYGTEFRMNF